MKMTIRTIADNKVTHIVTKSANLNDLRTGPHTYQTKTLLLKIEGMYVYLIGGFSIWSMASRKWIVSYPPHFYKPPIKLGTLVELK